MKRSRGGTGTGGPGSGRPLPASDRGRAPVFSQTRLPCWVHARAASGLQGSLVAAGLARGRWLVTRTPDGRDGPALPLGRRWLMSGQNAGETDRRAGSLRLKLSIRAKDVIGCLCELVSLSCLSFLPRPAVQLSIRTGGSVWESYLPLSTRSNQ